MCDRHKSSHRLRWKSNLSRSPCVKAFTDRRATWLEYFQETHSILVTNGLKGATMGEDRTSSHAFEPWLSRFEADVAAEGLERPWRKHIKELVEWHRASEATSMLGSHLDRILRSDPNIAAELAAHPAVSSEAALKLEFTEPDLNHPSHERWRNALDRVTSSATEFKDILEGDGTPMRCIEKGVFENWGGTIRNIPALTCFPRTKAGVCNIVNWAASRGKTVRACGYRHTWSDLYSSDGEVLISLLPLRVVTELPAEEPPSIRTTNCRGSR
jgi:hypothetical protein